MLNLKFTIDFYCNGYLNVFILTMEDLQTPLKIYEQQITKLNGELAQLKAKRSNLGWLRLLTGAIIISLVYYLFFNSSALLWFGAAAGIAIFLYLVSIDADNNLNIADSERLLDINNEEVSVLNGDYYNREDGLKFLPDEHPYAGDLDMFGRASLYQYINRCTSEQSKKLFALGMLASSAKDEITVRQETAKDLSQHLAWRQQFQSSGRANPLTFSTGEKITSWLNTHMPYTKAYWKILPNIFTFITIATFAGYLFNLIATPVFSMLVFIYFLFAKFTSSKVMKTYMALSKIESEVNTIQQQLKLVENVPGHSSFLKECKARLVTDKTGSASIEELKHILQRFDYRLNIFVFIILNTFLLWDVRQTNSLNNWKERHAASVPNWFSILANMEVMNTLATLTFNHPAYIFPSVSSHHFTFSGSDIGHPLINSGKRVNNSFEHGGTGKVTIVTGSNMAGKSTFLRSIGVNLVLAQMGAPVCAKTFTFSPVQLCSSMRIADNLAENTSTFYAELKKLKSILDKVKQHEKVFILLDEILRGTNSLDRHMGSVAFIKQLIKEEAAAVIATHDVELARLDETNPEAITNYHFDVQVEGEELYFDYKLKRGVCQSMNASLLMKKIGIEMQTASEKT